MDLLRLEDNCFSILGARDYTVNEINKTPYSIARVGEIKMVATNILLNENKLQAEPETAKTSDTFKYGVKARNYMGLANNIHYVGAVKSISVSLRIPGTISMVWHLPSLKHIRLSSRIASRRMKMVISKMKQDSRAATTVQPRI